MSLPSQPVAVTFPNSFNTPPTTGVRLMTLDPTRGQMVQYGTGVVSNDGTQIVPNPDSSSHCASNQVSLSHSTPATIVPPGAVPPRVVSARLTSVISFVLPLNKTAA